MGTNEQTHYQTPHLCLASGSMIKSGGVPPVRWEGPRASNNCKEIKVACVAMPLETIYTNQNEE
jgi:hypothetical protein